MVLALPPAGYLSAMGGSSNHKRTTVRRDSPSLWRGYALSRFTKHGAIAQLGERVLCKHEVVGSIPSGSTIVLVLPRIALLEHVIAAPLLGERK